MSAYYFGCWVTVGHSLHDVGGDWAGINSVGPFDRIDGELTPKDGAAQGDAALHHRNGWTALALHDYSVDKRRGSNSAFLFDEPDLSFEEALQRATDAFPTVIARLLAAGPIIDLCPGPAASGTPDGGL